MLKVGDKLQGRYEIKEIRMGGFRVVYIAFDHLSEKLVMIETLRDKYMNHNLIERFLEQSRIVMKLRECPHIVRAERVERIGGKPYIFWEYVDGWTFKDEIQNHSPDLIRSRET